MLKASTCPTTNRWHTIYPQQAHLSRNCAPGCISKFATNLISGSVKCTATAWEASPTTPSTSIPGTKQDKKLGTLRRAVLPKDLQHSAHKIFDEALITVKAGDGGHGEIVAADAGKWVANLKFKPGTGAPRKLFLPASEPADGADGADVMLLCDPEVDSLLHLHARNAFAGVKGSNANPAVGSSGPKKNAAIRKGRTPPLLIPVPPGTVVKRQPTGTLLGELIRPGDRLLVAKGGAGGLGVQSPSTKARDNEARRQQKLADAAGAEVVEVEDTDWKLQAKGAKGQGSRLQLLLRVVADVGIVGFPNAGKSSLLKALTRASPDIQPYPFTTLMPNLGVLELGKGTGPVLADLPGLIEGAHTGKGLGRNFLRHLRRTRILLHVVDGAAADPATDYLAVREELRMYNPEYVQRPHVLALNKIDLEDARELQGELEQAMEAEAVRFAEQYSEERPTLPSAVVPVSALSGEGLGELRRAIQAALGGEPDEGDNSDDDLAGPEDDDLDLLDMSEEELLRMEKE